MKKVLASLVLVSIFTVPAIASAASIWDWLGIGGGTAPDVLPPSDVLATLDNLTNWLFSILLIIAAIAIIVAGYFFVTAAGDPDKTKTARNFVLYALIGVLVGVVAKGLVVLVRNIVR